MSNPLGYRWQPEAETTDEQLVSMTQQYAQTHQDEYVAHLAYKEINEQVKKGRPWNKCLDCGQPYPLDMEGASSDFCSSECERMTINYLSEAAGGHW